MKFSDIKKWGLARSLGDQIKHFKSGTSAEKTEYKTLVSDPAAVQAAVSTDKSGFVSTLSAALAATSSNAHAAEAVSGVGQVIPANAFTQVTVTGITHQYGAQVVGDNLRVVQKGVYLLYANIRLVDGASAGRQCGIGVHTDISDGTWFYWGIQGTTPASRQTYPYVRVATLNAGDELKLFAFTDTSGGLALNSSMFGAALLYPLA